MATEPSHKSRRDAGVTEWQRCHRDNGWSAWVLHFGRIESESKTPTGGQRCERHGFEFGGRRYSDGDRGEEPRPVPVSHLRRFYVCVLEFPALPGWANFCRAHGAELLVIFQLSYLSYLRSEKTSVPGSLARPFRKSSS